MIRDANPEDLDGVLRLYRQLHASDPIPSGVDARRVFDQIRATPGLRILVLEERERILASTYLNVIPNLTRGLAPYAIIENVVVDELHRGMGLGKRIMAATLEAAWEAGCYKAALMTGRTDQAIHAFYLACGLDRDEKTAYYIRRPS